MTQAELRKLATYLQYRLDRAGESGDMQFKREVVERFVELIEEVMVARKLEQQTLRRAS